MFRFILALSVLVLAIQPALAKEEFNIKGVKIGDTESDLKRVFQNPLLNKEGVVYAYCGLKGKEIKDAIFYRVVILNKDNTYIYKLIEENDNKVVVSAEYKGFTYNANAKAFKKMILDKYIWGSIEKSDIIRMESSGIELKDYDIYYKKGNDILRLHYGTSKNNSIGNSGTYIIKIESVNYLESQKYRENAASQNKKSYEASCANSEIKKLDF